MFAHNYFNIKVLFVCCILAAKKASSPAEIVNQLSELGVASSGETFMFAKEIFTRVEHKASGPNVSNAGLLLSN